GPEPDEAREMDLPVEPVERKGNRSVAVARYVPASEARWLQSHRVELNAMTTPQFLEWLDAKMESYEGKLMILLETCSQLDSLWKSQHPRVPARTLRTTFSSSGRRLPSAGWCFGANKPSSCSRSRSGARSRATPRPPTRPSPGGRRTTG